MKKEAKKKVRTKRIGIESNLPVKRHNKEDRKKREKEERTRK
jgi:hypothetical protein